MNLIFGMVKEIHCHYSFLFLDLFSQFIILNILVICLLPVLYPCMTCNRIHCQHLKENYTHTSRTEIGR